MYYKSVVAAFVIGPTVRDGARRPQGSSAAAPGRWQTSLWFRSA
jgi:hypothetical protein